MTSINPSLNKPIKVAFFGTPQFSMPILASIITEFQVEIVITQPSRPVGAKRIITPSPVAQLAAQHQLPIYTPTKLRSPEVRQKLSNIHVDLAVVAAYGHILPQWLLDWPTYGCINIHASLLPQYRGASPIQQALLDGQPKTGLTYIKMTAGMDEGPIIDQQEVAISPQETNGSLFQKLSQTASQDINKVINTYINNPQKTTPQDHSAATYTNLITKQDGQVDLYHPPANLQQMIYAYHPWPGVWGLFHNKRVKLLPHHQVQAEGRQPTPLSNFLNGHPDFPLKEQW